MNIWQIFHCLTLTNALLSKFSVRMFVNSFLGLCKGHFTMDPLQMQLSHCWFIAPLMSGLCTYILKSLYGSGTHYFSSFVNTDRDSEKNETASREAQAHQAPSLQSSSTYARTQFWFLRINFAECAAALRTQGFCLIHISIENRPDFPRFPISSRWF